MLFETEGWEMATRAKDLGLGKDTDAPDTINLHLHVRISIGVPKVGQMRPPSGVLGVALYDDGVFVQGIRQSQGSLGLLPRVQVVWLLSAEPVGKRAPHICTETGNCQQN